VLPAAMQANWERKAVDVLKCRLYPSADFNDWEDFKHHCDTAEAHSAKISYCGHCGNFFAHGDALKRHCDKRPGECIDGTADIADWKRSETDRVHKEFEARLKLYLRPARRSGSIFRGSSRRCPQSRRRRAVESRVETSVDVSIVISCALFIILFFSFLAGPTVERATRSIVPRTICLLACFAFACSVPSCLIFFSQLHRISRPASNWCPDCTVFPHFSSNPSQLLLKALYMSCGSRV
jgi:hypothetical protein